MPFSSDEVLDQLKLIKDMTDEYKKYTKVLKIMVYGCSNNELTNMDTLGRLFYNQIVLQNLDMKEKSERQKNKKWRG